MKRITRKGLLCICAGAMVLSGFPVLAQEKGTEPSLNLNPTVRKQMTALAQEKAGRTPAQRKMSSQLVMAAKARRGELKGSGLESLKPQVQVQADETVLVDIKAEVSPELLAEIEKLGGRIVNSHPEYEAIRAQVPLEFLETLAEEGAVRSIKPAARAFLNKVNTSEGDKAHAAPTARSTYSGATGKGVKVGVLSDSVDWLSYVQSMGDLPAVTVVQDAPGNTGEGTAMLEIVHDLAPEAQLYFATAWTSKAGFATNIRKLYDDHKCDVIVDDVGYLDEFPFQDDYLAQAVNYVTSKGVLYFSSAGNAGNLNDGTSGVWEGDYRPFTLYEVVAGYESVHDYGGGNYLNRITNDSSGCFTLFWSDPLGGSANDYDLFLVNPAATEIVGESSGWQTGTEDPIEGFCANPGEDLTNYHLLVARWSYYPDLPLPQNRFLHLSANRGRLERVTAGQITGHPAAQDAFAVSAVSARYRTLPFTGVESVETFSTDGPRRVFYYPNGSAITPGNYSSTGGTVRSKPDITAADGVATLTPGFNPFYGTSAAAPHAAAIGALMLSRNPYLTLSKVRQILQQSVLDIEAPGWDRDSGYGILMADKALRVTPFPLPPGIPHLMLKN